MTRDEAAAEVITRVLRWEGGIADVGDGKGITRFGQTPAWLDQFGLPTPTTPEEARLNYQRWLVRTGLIGVCDYPDPFAIGVVDWAVHSGHRTAIRGLQAALGVAVDGTYGPETQAAVDAVDRRGAACRLIAHRARFVFGLLANVQNAKYARGWGNRISEQIESLA